MQGRLSDRRNFEVVVVGGGPAGSAVALRLARLGHEVLLLEKRQTVPPRTCGEYLSPECLRLLDRLEVTGELEEQRPRRLRGMRIHTQRGSVLVGDFPGVGDFESPPAAWPPKLACWPGGFSLPRPVLDGLLIRKAAAAGVEVRRGFQVRGLLREGGKAAGVLAVAAGRVREIRSPLVIGADGRHSVVAGSLDCRRPHPRLRKTGFVLRYEGAGEIGDYGEVLLGGDSYCILNPLGEGRLTLGLVVPSRDPLSWKGSPESFIRKRLSAFPAARRWTRDAEPVGRILGVGPLAFETTRQASNGVLLVGDAAGFYDPLTGEGIHIALRGAELVAAVAHEALQVKDFSAGFLRQYEQLRRRALLPKKRFCAFLQAVIRRPYLVEFFASALARRERLRETFMGVIGDTLPPGDLLRTLAFP